jgi:hypothetical protein
MFAAAEAGLVDAYLDCFTGAERQRLERQLAGQPREAFARSLVEAVSTLKGRAVFRPAGSGDGENRTWRTVDRVYANRTERQEYQLVRQAGGWRIETVRSAAATQPEKPYGSPVFDE